MKNAVQIKLKKELSIGGPSFGNNLLSHLLSSDLQSRHESSKAPHHQNHISLSNVAALLENKPKSANPQAKAHRLKNLPSTRQANKEEHKCDAGRNKNEGCGVESQRQEEQQVQQRRLQLGHKLRLTTLSFEMRSKATATSRHKQKQRQAIGHQLTLKSFGSKHRTISIDPIREEPLNDTPKDNRIRISKRRSEQAITKTKISIKNIDSRYIENKVQQKLKGNNKQRDEKRFVFFRNENSMNINLNSIRQAQIIQNSSPKQCAKKKRNSKQTQIPDFIKASLQNYNKPQIQPHTTLHPQSIQLPHRQYPDQINQEIASQPSHQLQNIPNIGANSASSYQPANQYELSANKMQLLSKDTLIGCQSGQMKHRKQELRSMSFERKSKTRSNKNRELGQRKAQQICGWQEMDPQLQHDIYLKL